MMRQQNLNNDPAQAHFIELLPRLRNGTSTVADWKILQTRNPSEKNNIGFENAITIYNDNDSVDKKNYNELIKKNKPITELRAINSNKKGANTSSQQFGGLVNSIFLSNECDISITNNLWGKTGIVNGCKAVVKDIVYPEEKNIDTLPDAIIVYVPQYIGPQFFHDEFRRNWIPIAPHSQYSKVANCTRKQFSLRLAYSITTHKTQGYKIKIRKLKTFLK